MPPGTDLEASVLKEDRMKYYWLSLKEVLKWIKANPRKFFKIYLLVLQAALAILVILSGIIAVILLIIHH